MSHLPYMPEIQDGEMNGKGSDRRPLSVDTKTFAENWQRTFGEKRPRKHRVVIAHDDCDGCPDRRRGEFCTVCDLEER